MCSMTTGGYLTKDTFWVTQKGFMDKFEHYADQGYHAYYRILHQGEISHTMAFMVARNVSIAEFRATMMTLWD